MLSSTVVLASACGDDGVVCPAWSFPAIAVRASSRATAAPLTEARGEVRDGSFRDSLVNSLDGNYFAADNRPGSYSVHLEHAGYIPWDTSGITAPPVGSAECRTVDTQFIEARLEASP